MVTFDGAVAAAAMPVADGRNDPESASERSQASSRSHRRVVAGRRVATLTRTTEGSARQHSAAVGIGRPDSAAPAAANLGLKH